jgi:hypothetical protein
VNGLFRREADAHIVQRQERRASTHAVRLLPSVKG